nr:Chain A, GLY-LYS-CYS-LEU-PHE-SER-ASN-PRO-PRO-ILE-CYS-PHE-PRO-ASN inhibitor [Helianthus annuus]
GKCLFSNPPICFPN